MTQKTTTSSRRELIEAKLKLDHETVLAETTSFVRRIFKSSEAKGIVVGLSGGIDSAVTANICVRAIGRDNVLGLLMFEKRMLEGPDHKHARWTADSLGLEMFEIPMDPIVEGFMDGISFERGNQVALGNLKARLRMASLYFVANSRNLLVAGTGDRSEDLIGYFTKYGDGGVDFLPIAHLYKSQVKQLGRHLGIPKDIVEKPSSPNLWEGHKATDEIPLDYDTLDRVLVCLFELGMTPGETAAEVGVGLEKVDDVVRRYRTSVHKRTYPPMVRGW